MSRSATDRGHGVNVSDVTLELMDMCRQPQVMLDRELSVRHANPAYIACFEVPGRFERQALLGAGPGQWSAPQFREALLDAVSERHDFDDLRVEASFAGVGNKVLHVDVRHLHSASAGMLLLTVQDLTQEERLRDELAARAESTEKMVDSLRECVLVIRPDLTVERANSPFYELFRVTPEAVEGQCLFDLGNGQWNIPDLRLLLERILSEQTAFDDFHVEHEFETIGWRRMSLSARRLDPLQGILLNIRDVTELARTRHDAVAADSVNSAILDSVASHVGLLDAGGRLQKVNWAWSAFAEAQRENPFGELQVGGNLLDALARVGGQESQTLRRGIEEVLAHRSKQSSGELSFLGKDGPCFLLVRATPVNAPGHGRAVVVRTDVTRQKRAEQALADSEGRLRSILDGLPLPVWLLDAQGRQTFVNRTFRDVFGLALEEAHDTAWARLLRPGPDSERYVRELQESVSEQRAFHGEVEVRIADGTSRRFESWAHPWLGADGEFLGVIGSSVDVTLRTRGEDALRALSQRLEGAFADRSRELDLERSFTESILESQPGPLLVLDTEGRAIRFNHACSKTCGRDFSVFRGSRKWLELIPEDERPIVEDVLSRLKEGEAAIDLQSHWIHSNGEQRLLSWNTGSVRSHGSEPRHLILSGVDVTAQRQAELSVRRSLEMSAQVQRQHIAGELAAYLAHELNQPLGSIGLFAESAVDFVKSEDGGSAPVIPTLEKIVDQAHRAADIVRRLRAFLQRGSLEPERVDIENVIEAACALFRQKAVDSGVDLRFERDGALPEGRSIALHLEQVLANLLNNALEAIVDSDSSAGTVTVRAGLHDGLIRITVTDTGPGIEPADQERLFRGFETSKRHGLGMGLRISRSLVEAMGGRLLVEPQTPGGVFHCDVQIAS